VRGRADHAVVAVLTTRAWLPVGTIVLYCKIDFRDDVEIEAENAKDGKENANETET
jgi:hypothetical protein